MTLQEIENNMLEVSNRHKHLRVDLLIQWLTLRNIDHRRYNCNTHFQLYKGEQVIDIWPTTNKIRYDNETFSGSIQVLKHLHKLFGQSK